MVLLKSFKDKLDLARGLSLSDWWILAGAWWLLPFFHLALRRVSYDRFMTPVGDESGEMDHPAEAVLLAKKYQQLIYWASRLHMIPLSCLEKSLTLHWILSRRDLPAQVRIGVNKSPAGVHAHAWVEVMGETVDEGRDVSTRFAMLESPAAHSPLARDNYHRNER